MRDVRGRARAARRGPRRLRRARPLGRRWSSALVAARVLCGRRGRAPLGRAPYAGALRPAAAPRRRTLRLSALRQEQFLVRETDASIKLRVERESAEPWALLSPAPQ